MSPRFNAILLAVTIVALAVVASLPGVAQNGMRDGLFLLLGMLATGLLSILRNPANP